jgi:hypothetical protein
MQVYHMTERPVHEACQPARHWSLYPGRWHEGITREDLLAAVHRVPPAEGLVCLGIEPCPWTPRDTDWTDNRIERWQDDVLTVIDEMRSTWPKARIGVYNVVPWSVWEMRALANGEGLAAWRALCGRLACQRDGQRWRGVIDAVDVLCPQLYFPRPECQFWVPLTEWVAPAIAEFRRFGKPLVPYIWHCAFPQRDGNAGGIVFERHRRQDWSLFCRELAATGLESVIHWRQFDPNAEDAALIAISMHQLAGVTA